MLWARLMRTLLSDEGRVIAQRIAELPLRGPIPPLGQVDHAATLDAWLPLEPLAVLGTEAVTNHFTDQPDSSRWYQGEDDLSAIIWLRDDQGELRLMVAVRDDQHEPATGDTPAAEGDALRLIVAGRDGDVWHERTLRGDDADSARRARTAAGHDVTVYATALPVDAMQGDLFRLSLQVIDRDGRLIKQTLDLGDVNAPVNGMRLHRARVTVSR